MAYSKRKFITQKQAAEQLGVTVGSIQNWMNRGDLHYVWVSGQRKLTQELVDHLIESRTTTGPLSEDD